MTAEPTEDVMCTPDPVTQSPAGCTLEDVRQVAWESPLEIRVPIRGLAP